MSTYEKYDHDTRATGDFEIDCTSWTCVQRAKSSITKSFKAVGKAITYGTTVDIHAVVEEDPIVKAIHENAEVGIITDVRSLASSDVSAWHAMALRSPASTT
jgi:hypothetical protein